MALIIGRTSIEKGGFEVSARHVEQLVAARRTEVEATVLGDAVAGLTVEFSRAVAGRQREYSWSAVTDAAGQAALTISSTDRVSGFYQARARTAGGEVVGQWHSIPLNRGRRQFLELTLGGGMRVVAVEPLDARDKKGPAVAEVSPCIPARCRVSQPLQRLGANPILRMGGGAGGLRVQRLGPAPEGFDSSVRLPRDILGRPRRNWTAGGQRSLLDRRQDEGGRRPPRHRVRPQHLGDPHQVKRSPASEVPEAPARLPGSLPAGRTPEQSHLSRQSDSRSPVPGCRRPGANSSRGLSTKQRSVMRGWGTPQVRIGDDASSVQQQVEIESARTIGDLPLPAVLLLDGEQGPQQPGGRQGGAQVRRGVDEAGLVRQADRIGLVERGGAAELDPGQPADGRHPRGDVPAPVSEVGAEADEGLLSRRISRSRLRHCRAVRRSAGAACAPAPSPAGGRNGRRCGGGSPRRGPRSA